MKKIVFIVLSIIVVVITSCSTDFTNPKNLPGSTWICRDFSKTKDSTYYSKVDSIEFYFNTTKTLQLVYSDKAPGPLKSIAGSYTYSIVENKITVDVTTTAADGKETTTEKAIGIIEGNVMSFKFTTGFNNDSLVFIRKKVL
jgi:hypothetical protein